MTESNHFLSLAGIMLVCGVIGGLANYWSENISTEEAYPILKRLSLGILAALVVPLFLNMISSSLLEDSRAKPLSLFIFAGFCIIAALSSRAFIESVTKNIIHRVAELGDDQKRLAEEVAPVIAKNTEPAPPESLEKQQYDLGEADKLALTNPKKESRSSFQIRAFGTDEDAKKVIRALNSEKYAWRYLGGIAEETGLAKEKIETILNWLESHGLASVRSGPHGRLWGLSTEGRTSFAGILARKET